MAVRVWGQRSEWEVESHALRELVEALEDAEEQFYIIVSPIVGTTAGREIDLLILTESTVFHVELKMCPSGKVAVNPNGRWECDGKPQKGQNPLEQLRRQYLALVDWLTVNSEHFLSGTRAARASNRASWFSVRSFLVFWPTLSTDVSHVDTCGYEQYISPTRGGVIGFDELPERLTDPCYRGKTPQLREEAVFKLVARLGLENDNLNLRELYGTSVVADSSTEGNASLKLEVHHPAEHEVHEDTLLEGPVDTQPVPKRYRRWLIPALVAIGAVVAVTVWAALTFLPPSSPEPGLLPLSSYVLDIRDVAAYQGQSLPVFDLDEYVRTASGADSVDWRSIGNSHMRVNIDEENRVTLIPLDPNWYGSEKITFEATFPDGTRAEDELIVQIEGPVLDSYEEFEAAMNSGRAVFVLFELDDVANYGSGAVWAYSTTHPSSADRPYDICIEIAYANEQNTRLLLGGTHYIGPFSITKTTTRELPMIQCTSDELEERISPADH